MIKFKGPKETRVDVLSDAFSTEIHYFRSAASGVSPQTCKGGVGFGATLSR